MSEFKKELEYTLTVNTKYMTNAEFEDLYRFVSSMRDFSGGKTTNKVQVYFEYAPTIIKGNPKYLCTGAYWFFLELKEKRLVSYLEIARK